MAFSWLIAIVSDKQNHCNNLVLDSSCVDKPHSNII